MEHTKTGAWLVNSSGLVVYDCRFRNTIADGINLCVGMQSTIVTNCTTRGTGDDCFAIWPATYTTQTYTPGFNVITHCTGQLPFLGNGGAIYGGVSNRIEDCRFKGLNLRLRHTDRDIPGRNNRFCGTTVAQRCDLIRCGGYDPGCQWRAALQLCLDTYSSRHFRRQSQQSEHNQQHFRRPSVIGGNGTLSSAVAGQRVSIPNYGVGVGGRNGLWARSDAVGSMTVSGNLYHCRIQRDR